MRSRYILDFRIEKSESMNTHKIIYSSRAMYRSAITPTARLPFFVMAVALVAAIIAFTPATLLANTHDLQDQLSQVESGILVTTPRDGSGVYDRQTPLSTDVKIDVSGLLARAQVKQTFRNNNDHWIEAIYAFPLPDESRVDELEMRIGERTIVGEIRSKMEARKAYSQALKQGKRASLLESKRANLFTNRVANIPPQETIQITFTYQWQVDYVDGVFGLRVPLTFTPRYMPGARLNAAQHAFHLPDVESGADQSSGWLPADAIDVQIDTQHAPANQTLSPTASMRSNLPTSIFVTIDTAVPLESVTSASHALHSDQTESQWRVSLANALAPTDRDFTLTWSPHLGQSPLAAVFTQSNEPDSPTVDKQHFASVMVVPPQELYASTPPTREVIFVIDTSGSMQGNSIRQARAALQFAIKRLATTDTFNVIEFNSFTRLLFDNARSASDANKEAAIGWVRALSADGGTEISAALTASLGNQPAVTQETSRLRQVVFITDGSVGNEAELFLQIKNTLGHSRLFTVGIGSAPNTWFMRRAAETGRGTYTYIAQENQVQDQMRLLLRKLERPVLTGITLEWDGIDSPEVYPAVIADLYAGEPILFDARWQDAGTKGSGSKDGGSTGLLTIHGRHNGNKWTSQLQINSQHSPRSSILSTSLEKQWAHRKIEALENSLLSGTNRQSIEEQIVSLALHYSMVTRYTSLIAVDQQIAREPATETLTKTKIMAATPNANNLLLPQGSLGIGLRVLLASLFSVGAILVGLFLFGPALFRPAAFRPALFGPALPGPATRRQV